MSRRRFSDTTRGLGSTRGEQLSEADMKLKAKKISAKCPYDLGFNPPDPYSSPGIEWRGKDCENIFETKDELLNKKKKLEKDGKTKTDEYKKLLKRLKNRKLCTYPDLPEEEQQMEKPISNNDDDDDEDLESKMDCLYAKWEFNDEDAKTDMKRKELQEKRRGKMLSSLKQLCQNRLVLCSTKDLYGTPKEQDERCVQTKACHDKFPSIDNIPRDIKDFSEKMLKAFDFSEYRKNKTPDDEKELAEQKKKEEIKKIDKELESIMKKYKDKISGNEACVLANKNIKKMLKSVGEVDEKFSDCFFSCKRGYVGKS